MISYFSRVDTKISYLVLTRLDVPTIVAVISSSLKGLVRWIFASVSARLTLCHIAGSAIQIQDLFPSTL